MALQVGKELLGISFGWQEMKKGEVTCKLDQEELLYQMSLGKERILEGLTLKSGELFAEILVLNRESGKYESRKLTFDQDEDEIKDLNELIKNGISHYKVRVSKPSSIRLQKRRR